MIFRYVAGAGADDNSGHLRTDTDTHTHGQYQFCKYEWGGGAGGDWHIRDSLRYPYAFVNKKVKIIDIAYSEERWPGYFFLMSELDGNIRNQLMTRVKLEPEKTAHSVSLAEIDQYVAEFKPDAVTNPDDNALRYTAFQPDRYSRVVDCPNALENGRIIALPDHLGEVLDINSAHVVKSHSLKNFSAEYQYPLVIGQAVGNLKKTIEEGYKGFSGFFKKWFSTHPIGINYETFYNQIEADQKAIETEMASLVEAHRQVIGRNGKHTLLTEAAIALQNLNSVADSTEASRIDYVFFLMSRMFNTLGVSAHGSAALAKLFENEATDQSKEWFTIFVKSVETMAEASTELLQTYRTHFNVLLSVTAKELAMAWVTSDGGILHKAPIERILVVTQRNISVQPSQMEEAMRLNLSRLGFTGAKPISPDIEQLSVGIDTGPRPQALVEMPFYEVTANGNLTAQGQGLVNVYQNVELGVQGGSLLLGLYSAYHAAKNWYSVRQRHTDFGALAYDPVVQISAALLDTFAAGRALQSAANTAQFTQGTSQQLFTRIFSSGTNYFSAASASTQSFARSGGIAANLSRFATIGNIAGAVGILLAGAQAFEAAKADDRAAFIGNSLVALGGAVILIFGASGIGTVVGLVLIISGVLITLGQDSDVDAWVRHSFWGSSDKYWFGDDRIRPIENLIAEAKRLAHGDSDIRRFFEQELEGYKNLVWNLSITNSAQGDHRVEIHFPGIESATDMARLEVRVEGAHWRRWARTRRGSLIASAQTHFTGHGLVYVEIPNIVDIGNDDWRIKISASFPKSSGGEFHHSLMLRKDEI